MRKKPPVLKKERGRFFEHGFEHGRRAERERERRPKIAQKVFAAAGNRRTETEGGEPSGERAPPQSGELGVSESAARRSHKKSLPQPETAAGRGEPGVSESAAPKVAQKVFAAAGNRRRKAASRARAKTEGGEPSVSESAA